MENLAEDKPLRLACFILILTQVYSSRPEEREDLFEGDLNIPELREASRGEEFEAVLAASKFAGRWPNGIMPYVISSAIGSSDKQKLFAAMAEWREKTCLKFVRRTSQKNYVEFTRENTGCWSNGIGRSGHGKQQINLDYGCWRHGTILHEIGHALGFWHEQSRPDRDKFVLIKVENIAPGMERQFRKYPRSQVDSLGVEYDYSSVMHYNRRAFSRNGQDTIVPKQAGVQIGQRTRLSQKDALQANLMYKCISTTVSPQKPTTPSQENTPAPEGYIIHLQSKKCFYPTDGKVTGENHPIVLSKCHTKTSRFRMYTNGTIQHVLSGMCVHPTGDCSPPEDNTEIVLSKSCGLETKFVINLDGLLIHKSRTCVRTAHDSLPVPENTRVLVHHLCSASKYAFAFAALPRTTGDNFALGKPAKQISTYKDGFASKAVDGIRNGDYHDGFCTHTLFSKNPWWKLDFGEQERVGSIYVSNRADCCWARLSGFEIRVGNSVNANMNSRCGTKYSLKRGETKEVVCNPPLDGRYLSISMENSNGVFLTLCEVAVYAPATDPTQNPPKPEIQGVLQHSKSKLCMQPKYREVVKNSVVVLAAKCSEKHARFRSLTDGSLQHVKSGMCLAPREGCMVLPKDSELILNDQCGKKGTVFSFTEKGSLLHVMSKMCVGPSSSPVSNEDTTMVVLNTLCDSTENRFELVTVPMPTPTSLPVQGNCGEVMLSQADALVIGGVNAKPGAWPWQVALKLGGRFICGGSLIKPDWVVTAAHCVNSRLRPDTYTVVLGGHNQKIVEAGEKEITVKRYIKHPNYNKPYPINNDIALLQLREPAKLGSRINTVCLPPQDYNVPPTTSKCYITGWGKIRHPGSSHPILQQAKMPPVSNAVCHEKLKKSSSSSPLTITPNMICGGEEGSNVSGCHGDSGGPYVCKDTSGRWFLQGIVSWGSPRCRAAERYTVFARVAKFRTWINGEIETITTGIFGTI